MFKPKVDLAKIKSASDTELSRLGAFAMLPYNTLGISPTKVEFTMTEEELAKEAERFVRDYLEDDNATVTFEINKRDGAVTVYAWIPKKSKHVRDNAMMDERNAVRQPVYRQSEVLKRFIKQYADHDQRNLIGSYGGQYYGVVIRLPEILQIILDGSGKGFTNAYGHGNPMNTEIIISPIYKRGTDEFRNGKLEFFRITKSLRTVRETEKPVPKKSYRY